MIPETPRVLFIADAGPEAGGGHLMRSLTLAEALTVRGAACAFLATADSAPLLETFAPAMSRIDASGSDRASLAAAWRDRASTPSSSTTIASRGRTMRRWPAAGPAW